MHASMTRQHFQAIARVIAETPNLSQEQRTEIADRMVSALYPFNHNISRDRFLAAATDVPGWVKIAETHGSTPDSPFPTIPASHTQASPFEVVGAGTYDAGNDRLDVHATSSVDFASQD